MKHLFIILVFVIVTVVACDNNTTNNPQNNNNWENCANGIDDDGDGLVDCNDPDCQFTGSCIPPRDCGNNYVDSDEECDGNDLNGKTCAEIISGTSGALNCLDCAFDTRGCKLDTMKIYQSGARIKMRVGRTPVPDGSIEFRGWYDTQLSINCKFMEDVNGMTKCFPEIMPTKVFYRDSGCLYKLPAFTKDVSLPTGTMISISEGYKQAKPYTIIGPYVASVYRTEWNECRAIDNLMASTYNIYNAAENVTTSFQEQLQSIE